MTDPVPQVSVLIPSIGRETLLRTLETTRASLIAAKLKHEFVIVDDSGTGAVDQLLGPGVDRTGVRIVLAGDRNIARARNLSVEAARAEYFAFVDDDEWVDAHWAVEHLRTLAEQGADASIGSVEAHYAPGSPRWMVEANLYSRGPTVGGQRVVTGSTANAWIRAHCFTADRYRFDEALGKSGGEDANLFVRLNRAGYLLMSSAAKAHENVPIDRASLRNLSERALRVGHTFAYNTISGSAMTYRAVFYAKAAVQAGGALGLAAAFLPASRGKALSYYILALRNLGKLRHMAGRHIIQYYAS